MLILEDEPVFAVFEYLHRHFCLTDPMALGHVGPQQVFPGVPMTKAFAEVFFPMLALVIQKAAKVLYPGVVEFSRLLDQ